MSQTGKKERKREREVREGDNQDRKESDKCRDYTVIASLRFKR